MTINFIHATSSPEAMPPDNGNRRFFTIPNDGIDATEVQERLDWKALRDMITVDTSLLEFMPTGQHQVAAMANLGAELLQEIQAYRPQFLFKSSPAEIIGALIEEVVTPAAGVAPVAGQEPVAGGIIGYARRKIASAYGHAMPPAVRDWPAEETGYGATWGNAIIPVDWGPAKPGDRRRELIKAGALILAEIERLDRAARAAENSQKGGAA